MKMDASQKRISIYLNPDAYAAVEARAAAACVSVPAYLRTIALGKVPASKINDAVTAQLATTANQLERISAETEEAVTKRELGKLLHSTRRILKVHVAEVAKQAAANGD